MSLLLMFFELDHKSIVLFNFSVEKKHG